MSITKLALTLIILTAFAAVSCAKDVVTPISKDQAIQLANRFSAGVHWNMGRSDKLKIRSPQERSAMKWNPQNRWDIETEQYAISVDSNNGLIRSAIKIDKYKGRNTDIVKIANHDAINIAGNILKDLGIDVNKNLYLELCMLNSYTNKPGQNSWELYFRKTYKGYKYKGKNDRITLAIDPADGSLVGYGNPGEVKSPEKLDVKITKDQAIKIVNNFMDKHSIRVKSLDETNMYIVNPNNYWEICFNKDIQRNDDTSPKLSWVVQFQCSMWRRAEVWVDTETGTIIGGEHSR